MPIKNFGGFLGGPPKPKPIIPPKSLGSAWFGRQPDKPTEPAPPPSTTEEGKKDIFRAGLRRSSRMGDILKGRNFGLGGMEATQARIAESEAKKKAFLAQLTPVALKAFHAQLAEIKASGLKNNDVFGAPFYTMDPAEVNKALDPQFSAASVSAKETTKTMGMIAIGGAAIVLFLMLRG